MSTEQLGLVGDIGATNARFALVGADGALSRHANLLCDDHGSLAEALRTYLDQTAAGGLAHAALAVATSPHGDRVTLHQQSLVLLDRRASRATRRAAPARRQRLLRQRARRAAPARRGREPGRRRRQRARRADGGRRPGLRARRQRRRAGRHPLHRSSRRGRACHHARGRYGRERRADADARPLRSRLSRAAAVGSRPDQHLQCALRNRRHPRGGADGSANLQRADLRWRRLRQARGADVLCHARHHCRQPGADARRPRRRLYRRRHRAQARRRRSRTRNSVRASKTKAASALTSRPSRPSSSSGRTPRCLVPHSF